MKRIQILLYLLLCGSLSFAQSLEDLSFGTDSTFDLLTWNIERFPKNGQSTLAYVSGIIEALDVDLLAIQEVDDITAFNGMMAGLSAYEGYLESSYFAGLAYIYKKSTIQINEIYEIYTTSPYWSPFPRSPMVMDLNFMNERIMVINNHFKCCGDGILELSNEEDEETRRYTASSLLKEYVDTSFPNENTIVLGDLNDILSDDEENNVFQMILDDRENYLFADYDLAIGSDSAWSYPGWPSHLDHILITNELFDESENPASLIQTLKLEEYITGGWSEYDTNISDHRPVAMKLLMNSDLNSTGAATEDPHFRSYPNPFGSETRFYFDDSHAQRKIEIINVLGRTIHSEVIPPGARTILWNAEGLPDGVYFAKLVSENANSVTLKLLLRK